MNMAERVRPLAVELAEELNDILEWATVERAPLRAQEIAHIRALLTKARATGLRWVEP